jgi:hypothetical protein
MTGLEILALSKAVPGLIQLGSGLLQKQPKRPELSVMPAMTEATNLAKSIAARGKMPGYDLAKENIDAGVSNAAMGIREAGSGSAGVLGNLSTVYGRGLDKTRDLDITSAQNQQQNERALIGQLNNQSNAEQRAWEWNDGDDFVTQLMRRQALIGSGIQNTFAGASDYAGAKMWGDMYGDKSGQTSPNGFNYTQAKGFGSQMQDSPIKKQFDFNDLLRKQMLPNLPK